MSKSSTVQITAGFSGDGITATYAPSPSFNAASPSGGPVEVTLVAATWTALNIPAGGTGLVIGPGTAPDLLFRHTIGDAGVPLDTTRAHSVQFAPGTTSTGLYSPTGGTVFLAWT